LFSQKENYFFIIWWDVSLISSLASAYGNRVTDLLSKHWSVLQVETTTVCIPCEQQLFTAGSKAGASALQK